MADVKPTTSKDENVSLSGVKVDEEGDDRAVNGSVRYTENGGKNGAANGSSGGVVVGDSYTPTIVPVAPADSLTTTAASGAVLIRQTSAGDSSLQPITVVQHLERAVHLAGNRIALGVKRDGEWQRLTYTEYYEHVRTAAKAFIKYVSGMFCPDKQLEQLTTALIGQRKKARAISQSDFESDVSDLGLNESCSVGIIGFNSPEWLISDLGAIFAGGFAAGIYTTNSPEAVYYVAEDCTANIIVVENKLQLQKVLKIWDRLPELKAVVQYCGELDEKVPNVYTWKEFMELGKEVGDDILQARIDGLRPNKCCTLIYTSGTTGNPKGVMLSHDNLTWTARVSCKHCGIGGDYEEHVVSYLPLSHIAAQEIDIFMPIQCLGTVWFAQPDALKGTLIQTLKECRPTLLMGVPRVYEKIHEKLLEIGQSITGMKKKISTWAKRVALQGNMNIERGAPVPFGWTLANALVLKKIRAALGLDRCRMQFVGAAPVTMETLRYFQSINLPLYELYGMSECTGPQTISIAGHVVTGSCGITLSGVETKIANQDEVGNGEVCMAGRHVCMGYLSNEEKTNEAIDEEGWLHSGDIGRMDQNGMLYITGRIKELIITAGGENIAPVPIEDIIKAENHLISNVMLIGDKRKFLSCLLTLKVVVDAESGEPSDELTEASVQLCQAWGSSGTKVSEILASNDEIVMKAIQDGIDRANAKAVSRAQKVQKWCILEKDFSLPGGELGPTLKLRRPIVVKKFKEQIDAFYA